MLNTLISPLSGLRRLVETDQVGEVEHDFLHDKEPVWSPHNKIINVTPGPAFGSDLVTQFSSNQTRGMRGPGVAKFFTAVRAEYARLVDMQEGGRALFFTGSGTSATEAAAGALFSPEELNSDIPAIVTMEVGAFSAAMGNCVENLGRNVLRLKGELGDDLPYDDCREILMSDVDHKIKMVMAPHNETSAGVTANPRKIRDILDELKHPALLCIDGISSIASMPCSMQEMGIDMLFGCSQKGIMGTPGFGMLTMSDRAVKLVLEHDQKLEQAGIKKGQHYLHLSKMIQTMDTTGLHLETPGNYAQFAAALDAISIEGLSRTCDRHRECSEVFRAAVLGAGLELIAKNIDTASNAITAIRAPKGFGEAKIMEVLNIMFFKHAVEAAAIPGSPDAGWRLCATGGIQPQNALFASIAFLKSCEEAGVPVNTTAGILAASEAYSQVIKFHRPLPGIDTYGR